MTPRVDEDAVAARRETRRELAKLTATYYNGLAVSIFAVGGLAPVVAMLTQSASDGRLVWIVLAGLVALVLSLVMHLLGRYILNKEFRR